LAEVHPLEKPFDFYSKKNGAKKVKKIHVLGKERKRKGENDFGFVHFKKNLTQ